MKFPVNEPILNYAPGSTERQEVDRAIARFKSDVIDIPIVIGVENYKPMLNRRSVNMVGM